MPFNAEDRAKVARQVGTYVGEPPGGVTELAIRSLKADDLAADDLRVSDHLVPFTPRGVPAFPRPMTALGADGRALIWAGDALTGASRRGVSLAIAPGEPARAPDRERYDRAPRWRIAVHGDCPSEPLRVPPHLFEERSLGWLLRLLGEFYNLFSRRDQDAADQIAESVGWVVRETRFVIVDTVARLRPHVDRPPHPDVVAEAQPALRELVLDAARAFGQSWVDDVLGSWAHLLRTDRAPHNTYVDDGHDAIREFLERASPKR